MLIALKGTAFLLFRQSYFWTLLADPRSSLGAPISQQSAFYSKMDLSEELHRRAAVPSLVFIGREDPLTSTHNRRPRSIGYHGGNAASATPPPPSRWKGIHPSIRPAAAPSHADSVKHSTLISVPCSTPCSCVSRGIDRGPPQNSVTQRGGNRGSWPYARHYRPLSRKWKGTERKSCGVGIGRGKSEVGDVLNNHKIRSGGFHEYKTAPRP